MADSSAPPSSLGVVLRQAREARDLSLLQVAQALHIKPHYLAALENDQWDVFPSPAQARGFLRTYAAYLGIDPDRLLRDQQAPAPAVTSSASAAETPPTPSADAKQEAFRRLGQTLRQQREALGLSLEDLERLTHVKAHYLHALEEGRVQDLPSPVQGRGMLLHYARALHLDPEPLLLEFAAGLQAGRAQNPSPEGAGWRWAWRLAQARQWGRVLLTGGALVAMVLFVLWSTLQVLDVYTRRAGTPTVAALAVPIWTPPPTPTAAPRTTVALNLEEPTPVPPPETAEAEPAQSPPEATPPPPAETAAPEPVTSPVHLVVQVRHRAWLRVLADGQEVLRARVVPGESFTFRAEEWLEIQTGDAAALDLVYNQTHLGVLGRLGEPLVLIFTPQDMLTPTPLASPTPTITPTPTPTPTGPTPTPAGSVTPSPTATPILQPRP